MGTCGKPRPGACMGMGINAATGGALYSAAASWRAPGAGPRTSRID